MSFEHEALISAYLDGELDGEDGRRLEARLHEPMFATALARELALRSYLQNLSPEMAPEGLLDELELAVTRARPKEPEGVRFPAIQAALAGMSWMARGPAMAAMAVPVPVQEASARGASQATYALGSASLKMMSFAARRAFGPKKPPSRVHQLGSFVWKLWRRT